MHCRCTVISLSFMFGLTVLFAAGARAVNADETPEPSFERDIRPLLKTHCFTCHGEAGEREGELDLRLRRLMVAGGETGAAIVPGDATESFLFTRIEDGDMPPGDVKLTTEEVALIGRWIDAGAATLRPEPDEVGDGYLFTDEERDYWAFQRVRAPAVPEVSASERVRTPIDAFLLARLEAEGLEYSPEADKLTLLRRACFDLTGLPPTPAQTTEFMADRADDAYDRLVDRLLASPHYGERWGRHWLDAAGYADSEGYASDDTPRAYAYRYRDYVIRSLNADKPIDRVIREQLAGDEMVPLPHKNLSTDQIELMTATGYLRMAPDGTGSDGVDQPVARNQVVADTINIVSTSLLGLTVGCAQCHDHRYDPIPQVDYYRLRAIFAPALDWQTWRTPQQRLVSLYTDEDRAASAVIEEQAKALDAARTVKQQEYIDATLEKEFAKLEPELREQVRAALDTGTDKRTPEQKKLLRDHPATNVTAGSLYLYDPPAAEELKKMAAEAQAVRDTKTTEEFVRALTEVVDQIPETHLFVRGDHEQPGEAVVPAGLTIVSRDDDAGTAIPENSADVPTSGRRLAYAQYLTDGKHPLTARVIVNRVWMQHLGRGIVDTPGDFGTLGSRPTHPELLDWLADDFVAGGWQLKRLHKLIMTSTAYRQRAERSGRLDELDPDNKLYARMSVRRLEAEVIRDAMLLASGKLNRRMFGTSVPVREDEVGQVVVGIDTTDSAGRPTGEIVPLGGEEFRRSVYVTVRRSQPLAVLDTFDAPVMEPNCDRRIASTVAPQSLLLMNSDFIRTMAGHFAERVAREAGDDAGKRVQRAWRIAYGRAATDEEVEEAVSYLTAQIEHLATESSTIDTDAEGNDTVKSNDNATPPATHALTNLCQALMSSNRFLYVD